MKRIACFILLSLAASLAENGRSATLAEVEKAIGSAPAMVSFVGRIDPILLDSAGFGEMPNDWGIYILGKNAPLNAEQLKELLAKFRGIPILLELEILGPLDLTVFDGQDIRMLSILTTDGYFGPESALSGSRLRVFEWQGSSWTNLSVLESSTELKCLELWNRVEDAVTIPDSFWARDQKLESLKLVGNWIFPDTEISLPSLSHFEASHNPHLFSFPVFREKTLESVSLFDSAVTNISSIAGHPLIRFHAKGVPLANLAELSQLDSLHFLALTDIPVSTAEPLRGLRLRELDLSGTGISDLSPLRGMPLQSLDIFRSHVRNLNGIEDLPLQTFVFDPEAITNGMDILRGKLSIRRIGTKGTPPYPSSSNPADFWSTYDKLHPSTSSVLQVDWNAKNRDTLVLFPSEFDFGEVTDADRPSLYAMLRNHGNRTVRIVDCIRTCVCADLKCFPREIPPGGWTEVRCTLDPNVFSGPFLKTFFIKTDDPVTPSIRVHIRGSVRELWQVEPCKWHQMRLGETNAILHVKASPDAPVLIRSEILGPNGATFEFRPSGTRKWDAIFTPPDNMQPGQHQWIVNLFSENEFFPEGKAPPSLSLHIERQVGEHWKCVPARLRAPVDGRDFIADLLVKPADGKDLPADINPSAIAISPKWDHVAIEPLGPPTWRGIPLRLTIGAEMVSSWEFPKTFYLTVPNHGVASVYFEKIVSQAATTDQPGEKKWELAFPQPSSRYPSPSSTPR